MKTPQELAEVIMAFYEHRLTRLRELKRMSSRRKRKRLNKEIEALEKRIDEISKWKAVM